MSKDGHIHYAIRKNSKRGHALFSFFRTCAFGDTLHITYYTYHQHHQQYVRIQTYIYNAIILIRKQKDLIFTIQISKNKKRKKFYRARNFFPCLINPFSVSAKTLKFSISSFVGSGSSLPFCNTFCIAV